MRMRTWFHSQKLARQSLKIISKTNASFEPTVNFSYLSINQPINRKRQRLNATGCEIVLYYRVLLCNWHINIFFVDVWKLVVDLSLRKI
eukprot:m.135493 g.135493  ORF g.135493 m.135493 type:complete len:89 (-) comp10044_c0_seq1:81-347(-)